MDYNFTPKEIFDAFPREPWEHQHRCINDVFARINSGVRSIVLGSPTGCHAKGHPILMFDGTTKPVEDIAVGDLVMGPDSTPREVLQLHNGFDDMYEIKPRRGDSFWVNAGHVLSLRRGIDSGRSLRYETVDMPVHEYIKQTKNFKHMSKLQRCAIDFDEIPEEVVDPYMIGVFLGDGCITRSVGVCKPDEEIKDACRELAMRHGLNCHVYRKTSKINGIGSENGNVVLKWIRENGLNVSAEHKFVPYRFLVSSRRQRLELLAGLLDTDGSMQKGGYDFISKSKRLSEAVTFLCRSVGLRAKISGQEKYSQLGSGGIYWRVCISGDCEIVPCRIPRKKSPPRKMKKDCTVDGFDVIPAGHGEYFGFTLDGDHRYLDGNFVRHHNSGKSLLSTAMCNMVTSRGGRVIIYNSRRLLTQQSYDNFTRDGIAAGARASAMKDQYDHNATVQVAQLQTDIKRVLTQECWELYPADLVIIDEAHMSLSEKPVELIQKYLGRGATVLGLTGTPIGMSGVYKECVVAAKNSELRACGAHVPVKCFSVHEMDVSQVKREVSGEFSEKEISKKLWSQAIVGYIYEDWKRLNPDGGMTLCAAPGIGESIWVSEKFRDKGLRVAHIDCNKVVVNGETYQNDTKGVVRNQVIQDFRNGMYDVMCHCSVLTEGVDIPELRHLILARPYGSLQNYIQSVGRVIRKAPGKDFAVVQDHGASIVRHGSPNADRPWDEYFFMNEKEIESKRKQDIQENKEPNPIVCPKCGTVRKEGIRCPTCGHQADPRTRIIVEKSGKLVEKVFDDFAPPKPPKPKELNQLNQVFFSLRRSRGEAPGDSQVMAVYKNKHGNYPPEHIVTMWYNERELKRQQWESRPN